MTTARRVGIASATTLFGLALAIGVASAAAPKWVQKRGLDAWNVSNDQEQLQVAEQRSAELDVRFDETERRMELKEHLITGLLVGRIHMTEVVTEFMAFNEQLPGALVTIRQAYSGNSDEEKTARNVVSYSLSRLPSSFGQKIEVMARLSTEFNDFMKDRSHKTQ